MATYTVTTLADGGAGSLREAIGFSNMSGVGFNGAGADTIVFDAALAGTITVLTVLPTITGSLTITGQGADKTVISGNNLTRLLVIADPDDSVLQTVRIEQLTLTEAKSSSSPVIANKEATTLDHVAITNSTNTGAGPGAVNNQALGVMTISNSTLSGNKVTTYYGGAVVNQGALTVVNSTFYDNQSVNSGGGAIFAIGTAKSTTIQNSTFVNNTAPSGGALYVGGDTTTISNSIFAGNTATTGSAITHSGGPAPTITYNLIQGTYWNSGAGDIAPDATNVTGAAAAAYIPGAATLVGGLGIFIPAADSPVVDKGSPGYSGPATDVLGNARVFGGRVDIGAVEDQTARPAVATANPPATPPTVAQTVGVNFTSVLGSPGFGAGAVPPTVTTPAGQVLPNPLLEQQKAVAALIAKVDAGQMTLKAAQDIIVDMADGTTSVASMSYQFFTGRLPTKAGLDYLVSSPQNPADLNDGYYAGMSLENRYINFAVNLGKLGEGSAKFTTDYGSLSLSDATAKAYALIFGTVPDAAKLSAILTPERTAYLTALGGDAIGTKAAMVGFLLGEAAKADLGPYAVQNENFLYDLLDGVAAFGADAHIYLGAGPTTVGLVGVA